MSVLLHRKQIKGILPLSEVSKYLPPNISLCYLLIEKHVKGSLVNIARHKITAKVTMEFEVYNCRINGKAGIKQTTDIKKNNLPFQNTIVILRCDQDVNYGSFKNRLIYQTTK